MLNRFGSTSDMVIWDVQENGRNYILAIDEKGLYLTTPDYLDKNRADPNRYMSSRAAVPARLAALQLDPAALLSANQHRVRKAGEGEAKKKVNPLKASKRSMRA